MAQGKFATASAPGAVQATRIDGVVIGVLLGLDESGAPLVAFPGNPLAAGTRAKTTAELHSDDVGKDVAILFEQGDPRLPMVIGRIRRAPGVKTPRGAVEADLDGERLLLTANREIVLRCGKASITLTRAGKVIVRGAYLSSRSSGVNRIKGGSVQIN